MRFKRTLGMRTRAVLLLLLLSTILVSFPLFILQVQSNRSSNAIGQGVLMLMRESYIGVGTFEFPKQFAEKMKLPYEIVNIDTTSITNSLFYDGEGNPKWIMVYLCGHVQAKITDSERAVIDAYEQTYNVTEASCSVLREFTNEVWRTRYGVNASIPSGSVAVYNVTWVANNMRMAMQFEDKNYTKVLNITCYSNVIHYAYAGNNTQNMPFLWAYTDAYGVTRVATSHIDAAPLYKVYWSWMPTTLALKLNVNNILFNTYVAYDIHDLNSEGYGSNMHATEGELLVEMYQNYSVPWYLGTMQCWKETKWLSDYDDFWDVTIQHPEAFTNGYHINLATYYTAEEAWNLLNSKGLDVLPTYYPYFIPGAWAINQTVLDYWANKYHTKMVGQEKAYVSPSQFNGSIWIVSAHGWGTNNSTLRGLWEGSPYFDTYAAQCAYVVEIGYKAILHVGYCLFWGHYPGFCNEMPIVRNMKDCFFDIDIYPYVGCHSQEMQIMARTIGQEGAYNITDLLYHPDTDTLSFKLVSKGTAPDPVCGLIVPYSHATMDEPIAIHESKASTFLSFLFEADKTYTIYVGEQCIDPHFIETQAWLSSASYGNEKLTFTVSAASGVSSTTKVCCGNKGKPVKVSGASSWSYNISTTILTLKVVHDGPANILVDWRIPGDVNGDHKVDHSDLFDLNKAYGSDPSKHNWNSDCDFNWDSKVDASDLFDLSKNYGKTKT